MVIEKQAVTVNVLKGQFYLLSISGPVPLLHFSRRYLCLHFPWIIISLLLLCVLPTCSIIISQVFGSFQNHCCGTLLPLYSFRQSWPEREAPLSTRSRTWKLGRPQRRRKKTPSGHCNLIRRVSWSFYRYNFHFSMLFEEYILLF